MPGVEDVTGLDRRRLVDRRLAELQRRQFGAFSRAQALRVVGATPSTIDGRVAAGRYRVLLPGVLAEQGLPDSWELRTMAAVLWVGGEVAVARASAARLHGLPLPGSLTDGIHLLVRSRSYRSPPRGITVHRTTRLSPADVMRVGPLPLTVPTRTVCDLAGTLGPTALRRLVAGGVREGLTDASSLRATMRWLGRFRGAVALRALVDELSPLDAQCRSEFETVYLRMARRHGIEPTAMNHPTRDAHGHRRYLDAVYLPEHVWVELDSRRFHGTLLDQNDDVLRTLAVRAAGDWPEPLRFTWEDVTDRPADVAAQVRHALEQAGATA